MGSSLDALNAGYMPKKIPTDAEKPIPMANDHHGSEIGKPDTAVTHGGEDTGRAPARERLAQIERVGDWIEHGSGGHVALGRMERRRKLDVGTAYLPGEREPLFNRQVRVGIAQCPRSQLLQCRGKQAELHRPRSELLDLHTYSRAIPLPVRSLRNVTANSRNTARANPAG